MSVDVKAQLSSIDNSLSGDQNSDLVSRRRKGQGRTRKIPHFNLTGFVIKSLCVLELLISYCICCYFFFIWIFLISSYVV